MIIGVNAWLKNLVNWHRQMPDKNQLQSYTCREKLWIALIVVVVDVIVILAISLIMTWLAYE